VLSYAGERVGFWLIFLNRGNGRNPPVGFQVAETSNIVRSRRAIAYYRPNTYGPCGLSIFRRQRLPTPENLVPSMPNTYFGTPEMGWLQFSSPP